MQERPIYDALVAEGIKPATPEHAAWPAGADPWEHVLAVGADITARDAQCDAIMRGDLVPAEPAAA